MKSERQLLRENLERFRVARSHKTEDPAKRQPRFQKLNEDLLNERSIWSLKNKGTDIEKYLLSFFTRIKDLEYDGFEEHFNIEGPRQGQMNFENGDRIEYQFYQDNNYDGLLLCKKFDEDDDEIDPDDYVVRFISCYSSDINYTKEDEEYVKNLIENVPYEITYGKLIGHDFDEEEGEDGSLTLTGRSSSQYR